jgi:Type II secretion system (T2SS), protein N
VKRGGWVAVAAAAVFVVVLVARMPASWVIPTSGANALCASVDGSLWSGSCSAMSIAHNPVGDVSWELHPLRLFLGQLAVHATAVHGTAQASADVELSFGQRITARKLVGDLPLDPAIIPGLPASLRGRAHFDLPLARLEHGIVTQLQGRIEVHDLEDRSGEATALGSYVIEFPAAAGGEPVGKLHDLEGPLAVQGTMRLTRQPGFDLQGEVTARPGAPPELINNIRFLGSPDALGRRPFGISGTL